MELSNRLVHMKQEKSASESEKIPVSYPLRVQAIRSKGQQPRLYVSFPLALAAAIGLEAGDTVQWELLDRGELHLVRLTVPATIAKTKAGK